MIESNCLIFWLRYIYNKEIRLIKDLLLPTLLTAIKFKLKNFIESAVLLIDQGSGQDALDFLRFFTNILQLKDDILLAKIAKLLYKEEHVLWQDGLLWATKQVWAFLLMQKSFKICETLLFDLVLKWAKSECDRAEVKQPSPAQLRKTLGQLFYMFRFPCMTKQQLLEGPFASGLFDREERNKLLILASWEGAIKPYDDVFLDRLSFQPRCENDSSATHAFPINSLRSGQPLLEIASIPYLNESFQFKVNEHVVFVGFEFKTKDKFHRASLSNFQLSNDRNQRLCNISVVKTEQISQPHISQHFFRFPMRLKPKRVYTLSMNVRPTPLGLFTLYQGDDFISKFPTSSVEVTVSASKYSLDFAVTNLFFVN